MRQVNHIPAAVLVIVFTLTMALPWSAAWAADPAFQVDVGERQLFLDDVDIAKIENITQTMHQPDKRGAVIRGDYLRYPGAYPQIRCAPAWDPELGCSLLLTSLALAADSAADEKSEPIGIGSRLELFVDKHLVDKLGGDAELHLHKPEPMEVVLVTDAPWEGNASGYFNVFQDGDLYRMYYRGMHHDGSAQGQTTGYRRACYAESKDGIHWSKPELGLFEFEGSKANNIVWNNDWNISSFVVFKDRNPNCTEDAKYKAFARHAPQRFAEQGSNPRALYAMKSPDAIHWSPMSQKPVMPAGGLDSQNLAFWDTERGRYVAFTRLARGGVRDILMWTSDDFLNWNRVGHLEYPGAPREHLYTNAILPYERAPHILLGFPTRFLPRRSQQTEPTFMSSRDQGRTFHRWTEAIIPVTAPENRDGNRSNYMAWGLVQLPDSDRELSVYATEAHDEGPGARLRRFTYRVDGFVSVRTGEQGGELVTKPLIFSGDRLVLNFSTAAAGSIHVELQDAHGAPIAGYTLDDCEELTGDEIERAVRWKEGTWLMPLAGEPVRLRLVMKNADLYSLQFPAD